MKKHAEMSQCRDALKWAEWFTETIQEQQLKFPNSEDCTEYLHTWFANAMMAMHDSIFNNEVKELENKVDKLKGLLLLTDDSVSDIEVSGTQVRQFSEFLKAFPEEK